MVAALVITPGCGKKENASVEVSDEYVMDSNLNEPGKFPICKEPVTLKILMAQSPYVTDYENNTYTKKLEELGNVKLEFELVPSAEIATKVNLIMYSGQENVPDIIITDKLSDGQIYTYGTSKMIVPLNKYYENSSYFIKQRLPEMSEKDPLKYITSADGNIYSVMRYSEKIANEYVCAMWIYEPWLKKLGLKMPETLSEFKEALIAFRDNDLNGNGEKDEIPLLDYTDEKVIIQIMQCFIPFEEMNYWLSVKDGKLSFAFARDEYKEGLKYLNDLYKEKLYSSSGLTMDVNQVKSVLAMEDNQVGAFSAAGTSLLPASSPRRGEYRGVVLKNGDNSSVWYEKTNTLPRPVMFITAVWTRRLSANL